MSKSETYYVGRVLKSGVDFGQEKLISAFKNAGPIMSRKYFWSFVDVEEVEYNKEQFVVGKLAQYSESSEIDVVEPRTRSRKKDITRNQIQAFSKFVYLPDHSGIVFQNHWNSITGAAFRSHFREIINKHYDNMFTNAEIEQITDYTKFATLVRGLKSITEIQAHVHIPNPLFGNLWASLNDELRDRNSERMSVTEIARNQNGLNSSLVKTVHDIEKKKSTNIEAKLSFAEKAILMAADGYGKGTIRGHTANGKIEIKTSAMEISFKIESQEGFESLLSASSRIFERIKNERNMKHGK